MISPRLGAELADELRLNPSDPNPALHRRKGVVTAVSSATGTCTVTIAGSSTAVAGVAILAPYIPIVNDVVLMLEAGGSFVIIGALQGAKWTGASWRRIDEVIRATDGAITFSAIPGHFTHLMIKGLLRGTNAIVATNAGVRFNGDTGNNYDFTCNTSPTGAEHAEAVSWIRLTGIHAAGAVAGKATSIYYDIPCYSDTTFHHNVQGWGGWQNEDGVNYGNKYGHGIWRNAAAITQIDLWNETGAVNSWATGSRATLYAA